MAAETGLYSSLFGASSNFSNIWDGLDSGFELGGQGALRNPTELSGQGALSSAGNLTGKIESGVATGFFEADGALAGNSSAFGSIASMLGGKGNAGTSGMFTELGTMIMPGIGTAIGFVLDLGFSSDMANKQKKAAEKAGEKFWSDSQEVLEANQRQLDSKFGGVRAAQGASGASIRSGTLSNYASEFRTQQQKEQGVMYAGYALEAGNIRKSGGSGGMF